MPAPQDTLPTAVGVGLPWDVAVVDAVAAIAEARARHGDSFVVVSDGNHILFTFSPTGVESFYALLEETASKGVADYLMLRRKLPDEIFAGRRTLPGSLFRRDDVTSYLTNLEHVLDATDAELGDRGSVDLFALTRRLGHRMGLASWGAPGCADGDAFERLVRAFDRIVRAWSDESHDVRNRGIAMDVALIHIASMSNLMAALGWAIVDLIEHPDSLREVIAGDRELVQRCALESTRMAQRSIMSRATVAPVTFDTGNGVVEVPAGWTIATLLPLLNTSAAPGLDSWDPDHWHRHRLADTTALASPMLVTAFGHGRHTCPAQPFSLSAMSAAMIHLLGRYRFVPGWRTHPRPVPAQIGGVARAADACPVDYERA